VIPLTLTLVTRLYCYNLVKAPQVDHELHDLHPTTVVVALAISLVAAQNATALCADAHGLSGILRSVQLRRRESTRYGEHRAVNGFLYKTSADNRSECRKGVVASAGVSARSVGMGPALNRVAAGVLYAAPRRRPRPTGQSGDDAGCKTLRNISQVYELWGLVGVCIVCRLCQICSAHCC
jgi:hypothetical protein